MSETRKRGRIETETGKECPIAPGSLRRDEETKAYTEKLQIMEGLGAIVLNSR